MAALFVKLKDRASTFLAGASRQRAGTPAIVIAIVLVGLPVWCVVTLPLCLIGILLRCACPPRKNSNLLLVSDTVARETKKQAELGLLPLAQRPLDVVVFGATGLTGGRLLEFLVAEYPHLQIGLAGRSAAKLEKVRAGLPLAAKHSEIELIVVDCADIASLFAMCRRTKVVATTVGPFARFGNLVYHACAHSGTHYTDITGESGWVNHMAKIYDPVARRTGASLVSNSGVDSVPSDLCAYLLCCRFAAKFGAEATAIAGHCPKIENIEVVVTRFTGGIPAGTLETMSGVLDGTDVLQLPPVLYGTPEKVGGQPSANESRVPARLGSTTIAGLGVPLRRSRGFKQWTVPFFMAGTNSNMVRRANSVLGYARNIKYTERWGFPDVWAAAQLLLTLYVMGSPWVALPTLRSMLRAAGVLPRPDAGAHAESEADTLKGSIVWLARASGKDSAGQDASVHLRVSGLGSAGVGFTVVCHGAIASLLATGPARAGAGLSPVAAVGGDVLATALEKTDLVFVDDVPPELLA